LDALQLARRHKVGTPANWQVGEDVVILPSVDDVEAEELFPKGFHALKPYLRITPQPDSTS
jgi:thioredoxin-dependent peroxiredoxin